MTGPAIPHANARVLVVDDHPLFRRGLVDMLQEEPGLEVCGEAAEAAAVWREIERAQPQLAILDLSMPGSDGLELIKCIRARYPALKILVLSMHDESVYAARTLRAGAQGYVQKSEPPATIVAAVHEILAGRMHVSARIHERLLEGLAVSEAHPAGPSLEGLSDRELEVLSLLGEGRTTAQIAEALHLSGKTVQSHREHLKLKLRLKNSAELVRYAVEMRVGRARETG